MLAGVPKLPVVAGAAESKRQAVVHTSLLVPLSFAPPLLGMAGIAYGVVAAAMGARFLLLAVRVLRERGERTLFRFSILHLLALFAALIVELASAAILQPVTRTG